MDFVSLLVVVAFLFYPQHSQAYSLPVVNPVLLEIARCESGQQQFTGKGDVITSKTKDYGYFQINASHIEEAKAMGYDVKTQMGNIAYALYLFNKDGTSHWKSSYSCWGQKFHFDGTPRVLDI